MATKITQDKLQLAQKVKNVKCHIHSKQIISLNINPQVSQENRIVCEECQIEGEAKYLKTLYLVELDLLTRYNQEEQQFEKDYQRFTKLMNYVNESIELIQNKIQEMLKSYKTQLNQLQRLHQDHYSKILETPLKKLIKDIIKKSSLDNQIFYNIAELLSQEQEERPIDDQKFKAISKQVVKSFQIIDKLQNVFKIDERNKKQIQRIIVDISSIPQDLNDSVKKWKNPYELQGHKNFVRAVAISQDDVYLASGDYDSIINIWTLSEQKLYKEFWGQRKRIQDIVFANNKPLLAVSQYSFDASCDILLFSLDQTDKNAQQILKGHSSAVWRILFTSDSQQLISGSDDKTVRVWNVANCQMTNKKELSYCVNGVALSPDQKTVLCGCGNGQAYLFDRECKSQLSEWQTKEPYIGGVSFTSDSKNIILGHKNKITVWDKKTLAILKDFQTKNNIWSVIANFKFNDTLLISNDEDLKIWNIENGELLCTLSVPGGYEWEVDRQVAVSSDLRYMVTGGKNYKVKIYERSR